jgi:hypothetical protein
MGDPEPHSDDTRSTERLLTVLKRPSEFRIGVAYIVAAWVLLQQPFFFSSSTSFGKFKITARSIRRT